jgi:hypothetical protein
MVEKRVGHPLTQADNALAIIPICEFDAQGIAAKIAYFSIDPTQGLLNHGEEDIEAGCTEVLSPPLTIPNGLTVGKTVAQTTNIMVKGQGVACLPAKTVAYTVTFENVESVTVPAGTFDGCIKLLIHITWQDAQGQTLRTGSVNLFLAPKVGLVKEIKIEDQETAELNSFGKSTNPQQDDTQASRGVTSHDLSIGLETNKSFSQDEAMDGYLLTVPYILHSIEFTFSENLVLTIDSQLDFTLDKVSTDEETSNSVNLQSEPALEWDFLENLSLTESFPFNFSNAKPGEHNAKRDNAIDLASRTEFAYSTLEEDLHGRSPWDSFKKGLKLAGIYEQQLYNHAASSAVSPEAVTEAGAESDGLDNSVGVEAEYSYFREPSAWMITPSFSLVKHLNANVDESLEIDAAVTTMKDFNTFLTGGLTLGLNNVKPDAATKMASELHMASRRSSTHSNIWRSPQHLITIAMYQRARLIRSIRFPSV